MKYSILLFSFFLSTIIFLDTNKASAQTCCPDFILKDAVEICPPEGSCASDPVGGNGHSLAACKSSVHIYTVFPNDPSFTYTWTVTGGTIVNNTGNPKAILWGNGATGYIKVVITSNNPNLDCNYSILMEICLIDGPEANFTYGPDTVCLGTPVNFNNTSTGGSVYSWDMGDGTTYTTANPPAHTYACSGNLYSDPYCNRYGIRHLCRR